MISGLYGMNFHWMPALDWSYGYFLALGVMGGICGFLYSQFKKAGWL
jgi:magnesium transporter